MIEPSDHPWLGALFSDPQITAVLSPEAELARMIRIEAAWTRCIAPEPRAARIASALEGAAIGPADLAAGTARDGVPVPALVEMLKATVTEEDRQWVHRGLTSQDVIDTALMLAVRACLAVLSERLDRLDLALDMLSARDGHRKMMAMTRMQPALPITVADRVEGWRRPVRALAVALPELSDRCAVVQWGGPVGTRDGDLSPETAGRFAMALGLRDPGAAWHNDRGALADLAALLSRLTGAAGKIGQDIALAAQSTPEAIALSGAGGSSSMAHKQNPVLAELLVALARRTAGDLSLMHHALVHEQERSGAAWMLEWMVLPRMLVATGRSLSAATQAIGQITRMGAVD